VETAAVSAVARLRERYRDYVLHRRAGTAARVPIASRPSLRRDPVAGVEYASLHVPAVPCPSAARAHRSPDGISKLPSLGWLLPPALLQARQPAATARCRRPPGTP